MKVVPFIQHRKDANVQAYGIQADNGLWFRWCYSHERIAEAVAARLWIRDATDQAVNFCADPQCCALSDRDELPYRDSDGLRAEDNEIPLVAKTAHQARREIKARWPKIDVNYRGYDKDGECVLISLVRGRTKGNVATVTKNRGNKAVKFTATPER